METKEDNKEQNASEPRGSVAQAKIYVLESEWAWDHYNIEYATITAEAYGLDGKPSNGYDSMGDPLHLSNVDRAFVANLVRLAQEQNGSTSSEPRLVRFYRVCKEGIQHKYGENGEVIMTIKMVPLCDFDANNNPIPVRKI